MDQMFPLSSKHHHGPPRVRVQASVSAVSGSAEGGRALSKRKPYGLAEYPVPEGDAHNIWDEDGIMYMGYYSGGGRVVDVSGELRGDLYRQGREIGRVWTGDIEGYRANLPFTWGAQPHNGLIYFNDINSGLWIVKLGDKIEKGSTTAPG